MIFAITPLFKVGGWVLTGLGVGRVMDFTESLRPSTNAKDATFVASVNLLGLFIVGSIGFVVYRFFMRGRKR